MSTSYDVHRWDQEMWPPVPLCGQYGHELPGEVVEEIQRVRCQECLRALVAVLLWPKIQPPVTKRRVKKIATTRLGRLAMAALERVTGVD